MGAEPYTLPTPDDLELVHELRTVQELRAVSDPLRVVLLRLLKEQERSVKELCELLGERSTRLYYHVRELERAGLVRLVRTETKDGSVLKYYRTVAMYVTVPFDLLHDQPGSAEAVAAVEANVSVVELGALDVRQALSSGIDEMTDDDYFVGRHYVRTTPERAREFVQRINDLHIAFLNSDAEDGPARYVLTSAFVPARTLIAEARPARRARGAKSETAGEGVPQEHGAAVPQTERSVMNSSR